MTSGPASRLLLAFCALADGWFNAGPSPNPRKVDCQVHGGRFDAAELEEWSVNAPAVRAACLAIASAEDGAADAGEFDFRLAAVAVACDIPGEESRDEGGRRMAGRIAFELAREQVADGRDLWADAIFSAGELARGRGDDIGPPRQIRAASLYSRKLDRGNMALWAVTWTQRFRVEPGDFALPLPTAAGIPATVLAGYEPDIGAGHEGDYEIAAGEGA